MSTFGAIHIDSKKIKFKAIVASSNKCIEGVPGMAFIISKVSDIKKCKGNSDNLCMDLYDQWQYMENTGRWRYTPPTHVAVAFLEALKQHQKEGGVNGRFNKYKRNDGRSTKNKKGNTITDMKELNNMPLFRVFPLFFKKAFHDA